MSVLVITLEWHSLILTTFIIPVFSQFRDIWVNAHFWSWGLVRPQALIRPYHNNETFDMNSVWIPSVIQRITKINSKSIQPITKLGTIYALRGLKRLQKTVVRLIKWHIFYWAENCNLIWQFSFFYLFSSDIDQLANKFYFYFYFLRHRRKNPVGICHT